MQPGTGFTLIHNGTLVDGTGRSPMPDAAVLGGDYGFAWNPHGDYPKELEFFVKYVGLSPLQVITCATKTGAEILGRDHELGTLETGKLGDVLVIEGDVLQDISILQDRSRFLAVLQGGVMRAGRVPTATFRQ